MEGLTEYVRKSFTENPHNLVINCKNVKLEDKMAIDLTMKDCDIAKMKEKDTEGQTSNLHDDDEEENDNIDVVSDGSDTGLYFHLIF